MSTKKEYITRREFEELKGVIGKTLGVAFEALDKVSKFQATVSGSVNNLAEVQETHNELLVRNTDLLIEVRDSVQDVLLRLEPPKEK